MSSSIYRFYQDVIPLLLKGLLLTLKISGFSVFLGLSLGFLLGILQSEHFKNRFMQPIIALYVSMIRGTPLFLQVLLVYFAIPEAIGIDIDPITAGVISLSINASAYITEIVRAGMNSVDDSQWNAGLALGYSKVQVLYYLILPQAMRTILPSLAGELSTVVKESGVMMVIGAPELLKISRDLAARTLMPLEIYLVAAAMYLAVTICLSKFARFLEARFKWA